MYLLATERFVINSLCKPDNLKELVKYICVEPGPDEEDKVKFK